MLDGADSQALGHAFVTPIDAERYVEEMKKTSLQELGSKDWVVAHERLEKLNLQAHECAQKNLDNYVVEYLVTYGKIEVLIHNLLVIEAWKEFALPLLTDPVVSGNAMRLYFIMYEEATICNLLEIALYHQHVVESCDDPMLELVDYSMRKVTWLVSLRKDEIKKLQHIIDPNEKLVIPSRRDDLQRQRLELGFNCAVVAVGLLRYLAEHAESLSLSVLTRLLNTHDVIVSLVPLVDSPPWTFRTEKGEWRKFIDHKWKNVPLDDLLQITKTEAQLWIAFYYLLCSPCCRERYEFNSFRKGQLLRLRKYLNELMLDQMPMLADVQRYMDELAIMQTPDATSTHLNSLVMEAIPVIRESLIKGRDWKAFCETQEQDFFSQLTPEDNTDDMKRLAEMYNLDGIEQLLGEEPWEVLSKPVRLSLSIADSTFDFEVEKTPYKDEKTCAGLYERYKTVGGASTPIESTAAAECAVELENQTKIQLGPDDLHLPFPDVLDPSIETWSEFDLEAEIKYPKVQWRQIGALKNRTGIVQMKFVRIELSQCKPNAFYRLDKVFLSLPKIN